MNARTNFPPEGPVSGRRHSGGEGVLCGLLPVPSPVIGVVGTFASVAGWFPTPGPV